jgi:hypothetical protein
MRKQANGRLGEDAVYHLLSTRYGRDVHTAPYLSPYDITIDGIRVEVKTAKPRTQNDGYPMLSWTFNIHRHGKIPTIQPDCYLLRLEDVPYSSNAIHLVFLAPLYRPTIQISIRALLDQRYHEEREQFIRLTNGTLVIPSRTK